jgi:hypothetical protein
VRSNEESKPPLSPTIILVGPNSRAVSSDEVDEEAREEAGEDIAGADAVRRGAKQKARLSAASSVVSAFAATESEQEAP